MVVCGNNDSYCFTVIVLIVMVFVMVNSSYDCNLVVLLVMVVLYFSSYSSYGCTVLVVVDMVVLCQYQ